MIDPKRNNLRIIEMPGDLVIGLERTACPGGCPDYSLFVHGDGRIAYKGRHYVAAKGRREGHISKAHVKQLFKEFFKISFFSLQDRYDSIAKDGAVTKTSIRADGRKKEVVNCHPSQAPDELYRLEQLIDEVAQSKRWVRDRSGLPVLKP